MNVRYRVGLSQTERAELNGLLSGASTRRASFRLRSRARNLATRRPFSYSMKAPATWRIILRPRSSLSVRSSPDAVTSRTPRLASSAMPQLLHDQVARKAAGILDEDNADAIVLDAVEQPGEAPSALDGVGTTDRVVIPVFVGDFEAGSLGEGLDGGPLPALRVRSAPAAAAVFATGMTRSHRVRCHSVFFLALRPCPTSCWLARNLHLSAALASTRRQHASSSSQRSFR